MSAPPDDDEVGYGRPPKRARFRKNKSGNRNRQYRKRSEGVETMTRILLKPVDITVSGERKRITALEAIILQLRAKDLSDHPRASKVRLKYDEFALRSNHKRGRKLCSSTVIIPKPCCSRW